MPYDEMSSNNGKTFQYSPDDGITWMGPFSKDEIEQLKAAGIIEPSYLIQDTACKVVPAVEAAPSPIAEEVGGDAQGGSPPPIQQAGEAAVFGGKREYYFNLAGSQRGPFSLDEARQLVANHTVTLATMCWKQGMDNWKMAKDALPEIFSTGRGETLESLEGFSLARFFADVFKRHEPKETVDLFCCGSETTTPPLESVQTGWPSPWIFARMLVVCLLLFFGFNWACNTYHNATLIPGLIFVGNFGVPFCVVILFFELNVRRDVPFLKVANAMVAGGLFSLIITHILSSLAKFGPEAYWAGPIEEPAKLLAILFLASAFRNGRVLTGLALGCAVGAGFAAFESAGYTYNQLVPLIATASISDFLQACNEPALAREVAAACEKYDPDQIMVMRALLTPFGHVVWTAITAGAFWFVQNMKVKAHQRAAEDRSIDFSILLDFRFLRIALIPVGLHMLWNSNLLVDMGYWKYIAIGIVGWIVALRLVQAGLKQVRAEQMKARQ